MLHQNTQRIDVRGTSARSRFDAAVPATKAASHSTRPSTGTTTTRLAATPVPGTSAGPSARTSAGPSARTSAGISARTSAGTSAGAGLRPPAEPSVSFRLLGPLEIVTPAGPLPLRGMSQRAVLAFLLLHANQAVATSDLMKVLWPGDAPATARKVLQNTISGLRGVLTRGGVPRQAASLECHTAGYTLKTAPESLDLSRFQLLAEQGRAALAAGHSERAAHTLRAALGLWRGQALQDLTDCGIDWPQLPAVNSARTTAQDDYFEAELLNGRHQEVIGQLETAAGRTSRERSCRLLMLALYRCGRQADALCAYERLQRRLREEFGAEPSRELRDLHQAIIQQDPALHPAGPTASPVADLGPQSDPELDLLFALMALVRRQQRPHVATLVGGPQGRKCQLISELATRLRQEDKATVWNTHTGPDGADLAEDLRAALRRATPGRPLVVTCENLHRTDGSVPEYVSDVIRSAGRIPLLVVLTASAEPETLWPGWNAAVPWSTTITV